MKYWEIIVKGDANQEITDEDGNNVDAKKCTIDCQDEFVEYINDINIKQKLEYGYTESKIENNILMVITRYKANKKLTNQELKYLMNYTQGQWSDGIGESYEQSPVNGYFISMWHRKQTIEIKQFQINHKSTMQKKDIASKINMTLEDKLKNWTSDINVHDIDTILEFLEDHELLTVNGKQYRSIFWEKYIKMIPNKHLVTVDAIILDGNNIALIKRLNEPYKDMWALPGGFVDSYEDTEDACIREAKEETCLDVKITSVSGVYAHPDRDPRGHIISIAYTCKIVSGELKGADDAKEAKWFEIDSLPKMAFDHANIINDILLK